MQAIAIPRTRFVVGLTSEEADRLALELARAEEAAQEPGLGGFNTFDLDEAIARRRSWLAVSMPAHEVEVGPFEIDVYPVTNAQWSKFVKETGAAKPDKFPMTAEKKFVTGISWQEADAYARHHGGGLPTEAEWECAARMDHRFFTWGDAYATGADVTFRAPHLEPYAVGTKPEIASPRGVHDLLGMFGEYCADLFGPYPGADREAFAKLYANLEGMRTVRGGYDINQDSTCVARRPVPQTERRTHLKFRCVRR